MGAGARGGGIGAHLPRGHLSSAAAGPPAKGSKGGDMKSIVTAIAAGLAVLAVAAPSPIAAPEASPTLRQFNALKKRVANLEADLSCLSAYSAHQYGDSSG